MPHQQKQENAADERPPVFGSWTVFYIAVVVWLGILIAFFYFFTRHFSAS